MRCKRIFRSCSVGVWAACHMCASAGRRIAPHLLPEPAMSTWWRPAGISNVVGWIVWRAAGCEGGPCAHVPGHTCRGSHHACACCCWRRCHVVAYVHAARPCVPGCACRSSLACPRPPRCTRWSTAPRPPRWRPAPRTRTCTAWAACSSDPRVRRCAVRSLGCQQALCSPSWCFDACMLQCIQPLLGAAQAHVCMSGWP